MLASIFLYLFAFFAGLAGASFYSWPPIVFLAAFFTLCAFFIRRWRLYFLLAAVFCLGAWRTASLPPADLFLSPYFGKPPAEWTFWVCADPEPAWDKQVAVLCPAEPVFQSFDRGKVSVNLPLYPRVYYGDYLRLRCRLEKPPVFSDFDYAAFLAARGIGATCAWPKVLDLEKRGLGGKFLAFLFVWKREALAQINKSLPEPAAGLAAALLLGYKKTLFPAENLIWQKAGLSHLVAISGGHITLFLSLLINLLVYFGFNKRWALWPALAASAVYVLITGVQASAFRSLLMGGIMLYAWRRGRLNSAWGPLLLAAAFMLWQNPDLWRQDLGFQLSFLALAGMIALYPIFDAWKDRCISNRYFRPLFEAFSLSLSAQLAVWPLLAWKSGGVSLIAPITNVLAFGVFSPLMLALMLSLALDLLSLHVAWLWLAVNFLLDYLLSLARWAALLPGAYMETPGFKLAYVLIYYLFLLIFLIWRERRILRSAGKLVSAIKKDP